MGARVVVVFFVSYFGYFGCLRAFFVVVESVYAAAKKDETYRRYTLGGPPCRLGCAFRALGVVYIYEV